MLKTVLFCAFALLELQEVFKTKAFALTSFLTQQQNEYWEIKVKRNKNKFYPKAWKDESNTTTW